MSASTPARHLRRPGGLVAIATLLLALTACEGPPPDEQEQVVAEAQQAAEAAATPAPQGTDAPPVGDCDATQVQGLVGQPYTDTLGDQARQDASAQQLRVLKPDDITTMEFVGERLNIELDENGTVSGVRCG